MIVAAFVGGDGDRPLRQSEFRQHSPDIDDRLLRTERCSARLATIWNFCPRLSSPTYRACSTRMRSGAFSTWFLSRMKLTSPLLSSGAIARNAITTPTALGSAILAKRTSLSCELPGIAQRCLVARSWLAGQTLVGSVHQPSCAKMSCSGQPARSSRARCGRKSKQAWARSTLSSRTSRSSSFSFSAWR